VRYLAILLLTCACQEQTPQAAKDDPGPAEKPPASREAWWTGATAMPSGAERVLAPREMRALLRAGERYGFDADQEWWKQRQDWVFDRILEMDPDDEQANAGKGFKTLQSIAGFKELWIAMLEARVTSEDIDGLIELYDHKVQAEEPIFLRAEAFALEQARLKRARAHLDRLQRDPQYEALQVALARVRGSSLNDYPFVHHQAGPFLLFLCARDLQRIEGEDAAAEDQRVADREDFYKKQLEALAGLYTDLLADIERLYPKLWKQYAPKPREIYYQWIFGDPGWYQDYLERIQKENPESPYRSGFLNAATGWAFLYVTPEPEERKDKDGNVIPHTGPEAAAVLRETAAYLAASQLMHRWGKDPAGVENRLDRSRAYWLKEGWPAYLGSRRVKEPLVGPRLVLARQAHAILPDLSLVVERESRLELSLFREPAHEFGEDEDDERAQIFVRQAFSDLAFLLVRYLNDDKRREAFERYLLTQIAGQKAGLDWFEECFGVDGERGWRKLQRAVYDTINGG
jgi:hypothetical protein